MNARVGVFYTFKGTASIQLLPVPASSKPIVTNAPPIVQTPGILGGAPRIAGRRIGVQHIAVWHERLGMSVDEITREFDVSSEEVQAAIDYYHKNREEIDTAIRTEDDLIQEAEKQATSRVRP